MMTNYLRILRRDQPINSRAGITRTQFYQHGDRMHDVAKRRRFDQQDAGEFCRLQVGLRLVLNLSFGEAIQFAKLSQGGALF